MNIYFDTEFHEYQKEIKDENGIIHKVDTIELISIGLQRENHCMYLISKDFDIEAAWENKWLKKNVLIPIYKRCLLNFSPNATFVDEEITFEPVRDVILAEGLSKEELKEKLTQWVDERPYNLEIPNPSGPGSTFGRLRPTFYAYFADYDWVVFCWLFGRMLDLPKDYPMYCRDLKQLLDFTIENKVGKPFGTKTFELELNRLKGHHDYPKQVNEHYALADAMWNKKLHEFILAYESDTLTDKPKVEEQVSDNKNWFVN